MDNDILNKRTIWEVFYDKLKLQTDQNNELVKSIVTSLKKDNDKLKEQNISLLEALKEMQDEFNVFINITSSGEYRNHLTDINIKALSAIQKTEQ